MTAYYNEHDPFAAAWLRELIKDGLIAHGEVDERSIEDVTPNDLGPFRQCHFFAGIGVWSLAARRAGIPDDAPLWTGSCPCQPFSSAGKGGGFADERHLWPAFHYLIEQCSPEIVVGEQVAGADGDAWFDLVSADLDATGYAFGAAETCAAGFGAPHERSRNYWVAIADQSRSQRVADPGSARSGTEGRAVERNGEACRVADDTSGRWREKRSHAGGNADGDGAEGQRARGFVDGIGARRLAHGHGHGHGQREAGNAGRDDAERDAQSGGAILGLADAGHGARRDDQELSGPPYSDEGTAPGKGRHVITGAVAHRGANDRPGPLNGLWRDADWLLCRDEKWRPVESSPLVMADDRTVRDILAGGGRASEAFTFPLSEAGTYRNRVGLLRGAGNACTLGQAEGFLRAVIASLPK